MIINEESSARDICFRDDKRALMIPTHEITKLFRTFPFNQVARSAVDGDNRISGKLENLFLKNEALFNVQKIASVHGSFVRFNITYKYTHTQQRYSITRLN